MLTEEDLKRVMKDKDLMATIQMPISELTLLVATAIAGYDQMPTDSVEHLTVKMEVGDIITNAKGVIEKAATKIRLAEKEKETKND
jgi:hypothetical protein